MHQKVWDFDAHKVELIDLKEIAFHYTGTFYTYTCENNSFICNQLNYLYLHSPRFFEIGTKLC